MNFIYINSHIIQNPLELTFSLLPSTHTHTHSTHARTRTNTHTHEKKKTWNTSYYPKFIKKSVIYIFASRAVVFQSLVKFFSTRETKTSSAIRTMNKVQSSLLLTQRGQRSKKLSKGGFWLSLVFLRCQLRDVDLWSQVCSYKGTSVGSECNQSEMINIVSNVELVWQNTFITSRCNKRFQCSTFSCSFINSTLWIDCTNCRRSFLLIYLRNFNTIVVLTVTDRDITTCSFSIWWQREVSHSRS